MIHTNFLTGDDLNEEYYDDFIKHYGMPRRSGRYPWGSGDDPYQHESSWMHQYRALKASGMKESAEMAAQLGCGTVRALKSKISNEEANERAYRVSMAQAALKRNGGNKSAAAREMGINESSLRSLLDEGKQSRMRVTEATAANLRKIVGKDNFVDVGPGSEIALGVNSNRMANAVRKLVDEEGYKEYTIFVPQLSNKDKMTTVKVLCPPGTEKKEVFEHAEKIKPVQTVLENSDGTKEVDTKYKYSSLDSKRVAIRYAEKGGKEQDGLIQIRPGCEDLSLGKASYAQVRIAVDGTHYLKGMCVYGNPKDFPKDIDVIFNTNKHEGTPMCGPKDNTVLKPLKFDKDNPFGASLKGEDEQFMVKRTYVDSKTGETKLSPINIVNVEGGWETWRKSLPSQFLSKQSDELAKRQLNLALADKSEEYAKIKALDNPVIKKYYLESFASDCDSVATHLNAAALPRQAAHVLIPFPELKDNEIYAPNYRNGEKVCLVRFPHAGTFEIPMLTVNNNIQTCIDTLGNTRDAVGINAHVAEHLSGADFDGDTAIVIPTNARVKIAHRPYLKEMEDANGNPFDPQEAYPYHEGMKIMTPKHKQIEMGVVSNLITDMTLQGATDSELARADKYSMVVIDSEKHKLDYTKARKDFKINELRKKYQTHPDGKTGAGTIISAAKSPIKVPLRKTITSINKNTVDENGDLIVADSVRQKYVDRKTGEEKIRLQDVPKMMTVKDAYELTSGGSKQNPGTKMEGYYAQYANNLKQMAREARLEILRTDNYSTNKEAAIKYAPEVASIKAKLNESLKNSPKERYAQIRGNYTLKQKLEEYPELKDDKDGYKKLKAQELQRARLAVGAHKEKIVISDKEWEAIQAHAVGSATLNQIIENSDADRLRDLSMPKTESRAIIKAKMGNIKALYDAGYTQAEIAEKYGVSATYISKIVHGEVE